jgi:hypothetical protein
VALSRELSGRDLAVVSVSFDDAEDEPSVLRFLASQGATFENLRAETGASPQSFVDFEIDRGIPLMRLYDRSGNLRKTFVAPFQAAEVEKAVKQLLAEPASAA